MMFGSRCSPRQNPSCRGGCALTVDVPIQDNPVRLDDDTNVGVPNKLARAQFLQSV